MAVQDENKVFILETYKPLISHLRMYHPLLLDVTRLSALYNMIYSLGDFIAIDMNDSIVLSTTISDSLNEIAVTFNFIEDEKRLLLLAAVNAASDIHLCNLIGSTYTIRIHDVSKIDIIRYDKTLFSKDTHGFNNNTSYQQQI